MFCVTCFAVGVFGDAAFLILLIGFSVLLGLCFGWSCLKFCMFGCCCLRGSTCLLVFLCNSKYFILF